MEKLLLILNIWLVLTALWLLITFRKFALVGAGAVILKGVLFAAFVFGIARLLETVSALLAEDMATALIAVLRATLVGTIMLVTLVKVLRKRARRRSGKMPSPL